MQTPTLFLYYIFVFMLVEMTQSATTENVLQPQFTFIGLFYSGYA